MIVCSMGGGFSSTAWMPRVLLETYDISEIHFVTSVLPNEHHSMWKLYDAVEEALNIKINYIAYDKDNKWQYVKKEDRSNSDKLWTPMDVFFDVKMLGNSRVDPCSRILKRETMLNYVSDNFENDEISLAVGIHANEIERMSSIYNNWKDKGYEVLFPLIDKKPYNKKEQHDLLLEWYGVTLDLYDLDFEHNNCGGACVKAGQRQWALLWYHFPEIYREWEESEQRWRTENGNYSILRKQIKGKKIYLTLKQFREEYLEPAACNPDDGFLSKYIHNLPGNPPCYYCAAI